MDNELVSQFEEADRAVNMFSGKIGDYVTDMNNRISEINSSVRALASSWEGTLYEDFRTKMINQTNKLSAALVRGNNLKTELDALAKELSAALEQLRKAGE
jgi:uncharacterized protein YukE